MSPSNPILAQPCSEKVSQLFSAAQIAASLGKTPQAVRKGLKNVTADGLKIVSGQQAAAWSLKKLPQSLLLQLERRAAQRGYRDVPAMLSQPPKIYQPRMALGLIAEKDIEQARKLREALQPMLLQSSDALSSGEMERQGVTEFQRVFGYTVTARHWRQLFKRTVERDNGAEDWNRLEIYLPEKPAAKNVTAKPVPYHDDFAGLSNYIDACSNPANPNEMERRGIWTQAFEEYDRLTGQGVLGKQAKRRIREFLFAKAPFLAPSRDALLKSFERKIAAWISSERDANALRDGRENNTGNHDGYQLPAVDRDLLIARAVGKHGGRIAPAWLELLRSAELTPATTERYSGKSSNKSHVPHSVLESVSAEVEFLCLMHQGARAFDSAKGYLSRDYSRLHSLSCMQADDFTMPVYFYVADGNWFKLVRGQCLVFIDVRSLRVLGFSLQPQPNYNALVIRSLCTRVFEEFGLPKKLYFERGIWERAKILKGTEPTSFAEVSHGLREFGIDFHHAIRPRSKVVERVGGLLQNLMESEPGYCGREERKDAPEILQKRMALVESRKAHPSEFFYSFEQWNERLGEIVNQYNNDPQQGKILAGLSPEMGLHEFVNATDPNVTFPPRVRFLLAHHKTEKTITPNGLTLQFGKQRFNYRGSQISHLIGQRVLAWFDPENPEQITITDLNRSPESAICASRSHAVDVFEEPGSPRFAREMDLVEGQISYLKARFNILKPKIQLPTRTALVDRQNLQLGEAMKREQAAHAQQSKDARTALARVSKLKSEFGLPVSPRAEFTDEETEAYRALMKENQ